MYYFLHIWGMWTKLDVKRTLKYVICNVFTKEDTHVLTTMGANNFEFLNENLVIFLSIVHPYCFPFGLFMKNSPLPNCRAGFPGLLLPLPLIVSCLLPIMFSRGRRIFYHGGIQSFPFDKLAK